MPKPSTLIWWRAVVSSPNPDWASSTAWEPSPYLQSQNVSTIRGTHLGPEVQRTEEEDNANSCQQQDTKWR